jgi:hypothetical protein
MTNTYDALLSTIESLHIVDTHEHLPSCEANRDQQCDVLAEWLMHYFWCDLVSAGLPREAQSAARDCSQDLMKRWDLLEPHWHAARSTGYGRSLDIAARDLYGVDGVRRETIGALNEAFCAARAKGGHFEYVMKEKSRIAVSLLDSDLGCDRRFFASVIHFDGFITPGHRTQLEEIGRGVGMTIHRLEDLEEALCRSLDQALTRGAVGLKCALAYQRTLHFAKAERADAEREFNLLFSEANSPDWRDGRRVGKAFQDYMMHALLREADRRHLTFQFHTGLQEGNGNTIVDSNPTHLTNLFLEYQDVRFDIFHMGYPYMLELGNLAKNFQNVFIDMCWGHIISPEAARRALVEWLDAVPANKISAFGGDYCFIDGVYGHQHLARRNVAAALTQKVSDGSMDLERAKEIARWLFVDNPTRIFNLERLEIGR